MTIRALLLGLTLGLFIAGFTFFNDHVVGQTFLIGNHLPASVFGVALVLLLINPLLRGLGRTVPLRAGELAVMLAMGLAVCAWPGSNLYRIFAHSMVLPAHAQQTGPAWHGAEVFSYVPGGSPRLGEGHVNDLPAVATALHAAGEAAGDGDRDVKSDSDGDAPRAVLAAVWQRLSGDDRRAVRELADGDRAAPTHARAVLLALNGTIDDTRFHTGWPRDALPAASRAALAEADALRDRAAALRRQREALLVSRRGGEPMSGRPAALAGQARALEAQADKQHRFANRHLLVATLPDLLKPPPAGEGVLLNGGMLTPFVTETLMLGWQGDRALWPTDLPWQTWWPTLRLWLGASLLLGLASLCLALIVHPQWSRRELLAYPTVRFIEAVSATDEDGWLPRIARSRLFWLGLGAVALLHLVNGLNVWFPAVPEIVRRYDFNAMRPLFPNMSRAHGSWYLFHPTVYFSVIGFAFFIQTRVVLSLGLSLVFWVLLGGAMIAAGTGLDSHRFNVDGNGTALRFGAYVGLTLMILYFGRWYYLHVLMAAAGLKRRADTPAYAVWAARGMAASLALCVFLMVRYAGLSPLLAALLVAGVMMVLLVLARVNVETGLFYAQPDFLPGVILAGFFGIAGLGPEAMIVLVIASVVFVVDPREAIMPYLSNGLRMAESIGGARPARLGLVLAGMIVLGLIVAGLVTFHFQHNLGLTNDGWATQLPLHTFDRAATTINELSARGQLREATGLAGLDHLRHASPDRRVVLWTLLGLGLVLGCAAGRLRLPWWPIHPVLFVVWGTYPANNFAVSFLVAAVVKWAIIKLGGERAHRQVKPMMVGLIVGELLMILAWSTVGAIYYINTGTRPDVYRILPG